MESFFATCPRGLELVLAEELRQLKAETIHAVGGGVEFGGDFYLCYRVNLESRIASRVLWQMRPIVIVTKTIYIALFTRCHGPIGLIRFALSGSISRRRRVR